MTNSTEFPRGFPRKLEGVVGKRAGNTERKPGRVREETLGQAKLGSCFRYIVGKSRHRAHTESQREESGESQFLGSLWRATLSREAWMPIWGLSTESMKPWPLPVVAEVMEPSDGDGAGVRVFQGVTTRTDPSRTERLHPGKAQ